VVARGVDAAQFDPALRSQSLRTSWGAGPDTAVLLCVGRLAREKNLPLLIRSYDQIKLVRPDVKLVLVGDGPARAELQALVPDAIFTGTLTGNILATHYASADIFGFPSYSETFGNVVLEAMASGLAVVAYDYAGAAENIQHLRSGLLARLGDAEAFVRLSVELAQDPAQLQGLRIAARTAALGCDWQSIVGQIESVMQLSAQTNAASQATNTPSLAVGEPRLSRVAPDGATV
jgi:glycosyltransferase involved in cell wall biosynthesis